MMTEQTDPSEGAAGVGTVVRVQVAERLVAFVVDVVQQVVAFTRQFAGVGARPVVDGCDNSDGELNGGAAR